MHNIFFTVNRKSVVTFRYQNVKSVVTEIDIKVIQKFEPFFLL